MPMTKTRIKTCFLLIHLWDLPALQNLNVATLYGSVLTSLVERRVSLVHRTDCRNFKSCLICIQIILAPLGKRGWKMFFCRLKELLLVLSPDEMIPTTGSTKKSKSSSSPPPSVPAPPLHQIKLHHAFATVASDYRKRRNVLRLVLADRSQFLFQSSDAREMHSWIDMINWNAARFSSPALEAPCSSSGRFEKPLLPSAVSRSSRREQAATHQAAVFHWEKEMEILVR